MELYIKNSKGQLEEISLIDVIEKAFKEGGFKMDNGSFSGEDHRWLGIIQESKSPSEITTNICFNTNGSSLTELKVFEAPIKRVVDNDRSRQII